MATVHIPTPLRRFTGGKEEVVASGTTIDEIFDDLEKNHPGLKDRLCDETGGVRRYINVYLGDEDIRFLEELKTLVKDSDEITIVPAIAGGK